jgi:ankyrin repeat protein
LDVTSCDSVASAYEHLDIIWLLLGNDANIQAIDVEHNTPLHVAADQGKFAAAQLLVEYGANVHARDIKTWTPLHIASWGGYPDIMRLLLEHGVDVQPIDNKQVTPLHLAANQGKLAAGRLHGCSSSVAPFFICRATQAGHRFTTHRIMGHMTLQRFPKLWALCDELRAIG